MESIKVRAKRLKDFFNLTIEDWDKIDEYQKHVCWLCGRPERTGKRLATDHSHIDGLIRGLLCHQCNVFLGKMENAFVRLGLHKVPGITFISIVIGIASYIQKPPAEAALGTKVFGYAGRTGTKKHRKHLRKLKKVAGPQRQIVPEKRGKK